MLLLFGNPFDEMYIVMLVIVILRRHKLSAPATLNRIGKTLNWVATPVPMNNRFIALVDNALAV